MRKPKTDGSPTEDISTPAGGRALERARQFARSRGLPEPAADATQPDDAAATNPATTPPPTPAAPAKPGKR